MTAHEVVIRLGRPFSVQVRGGYPRTTRMSASGAEVTIPFNDQASAEAALREITLVVRPVHDAGGEGYRPVVAGDWERWLLDRVLDVERHEAMEFFTVAGRRSFYPGHGPAGRLYDIVKATTGI